MFSNLEKSSIIHAFNAHLFDFLDDIIGIYPESTDIRGARASFDLVRGLNPASLIKVWYKFIYCKYADQIMVGNVDFFVSKDYGEDLSGKVKNADKIMEKIGRVRRCVQNISPENKVHVAKYILNLSRLSQAYFEV